VICRTCRDNGILIIADEIQTGFCRTGPLYACEQLGVEPDIILAAKSIAGGLPLAAVTGRAEIMDSPEPGGLGGTFGGNPVACAAALEGVDALQLSERSLRIGRLFESITQDWPERFPLIGNIRGLGATRAIELVRERHTKEPAEAETRAILAACHRRGLVLISAGTFGNVIRLLVPLTATDEQIKEGLGVLEDALAGEHRSLSRSDANQNMQFGGQREGFRRPEPKPRFTGRIPPIYRNSRGAKSFRQRRHVSHSWAVPGDSK